MLRRFSLVMLLVLAGIGPVSAGGRNPGPLELALKTPVDALPALPVEGPVISPPEPPEAAELLRQGHEAAQLQGSTIDVPTALDRFRKAAALGSFEAANEFAVLMRMGSAPPEQKAKSIRITRYLAANGYGAAAYSMGMLGFMGRLGPEDGPQASKYWFNIARRAGNADALKLNAEALARLRTTSVLPPGTGNGDMVETAFTFTGITTAQEGSAAVDKTITTLFQGWTQADASTVTVHDKTYARHIMADGQGRKIAVFFDVTDWR
ncbi:hypothetical protein [Asticcacaulis sp.]|uniref:hypothetical protein n=1 Tax=Asticcacaulis sp. TaxID=1872648 RepID=UPI002619A00E|nr:hypothetical protein [Asticcacaulis sp.]